MPSASTGLELPATSLMAPLLLAIPLSWISGGSSQKQRPDTSRLPGWQHESGPCPRRIFRREPATVGLVNWLLRHSLIAIRQSNRIHVPAVIGFGPMGGAAETEKSRGLRVGA